MKIKATILSPVHIGSGEEFDKNFNFFYKDGYVYLIDEFRVLDYFLSQGKSFSYVFFQNGNKKVLTEKIKEEIVNKKLYLRKLKNNLKLTKNEIKEFVSHKKPYIPGSSIKGAIRTAVLNCFLNASNDVNRDCIYEYNQDKMRKRCGYLLDNENFNKKRVNSILDSVLVEIFQNIIVRDVEEEFRTQVYKSINIKLCKDYQEYRETKVEKIANYVEALIPGQSFEIEIIDKKKYLKNLGLIANSFYLSKLKEDINYVPLCYSEDNEEYPECENDYKEKEDCVLEKLYFYKGGVLKGKLNLSNEVFLLNIGRFSGARKKSFDNFRWINNSHCDDKKYTTTKTYALEKRGTPPFFEKELVPFGWILCEILSK